MKWPLKYQVLLPMSLAMLGTIAALTGVHTYLAAVQSTRRMADRIDQVTDALTRANFPLTAGVLRYMQQLVGADFILVDGQQAVVAATRPTSVALLAELSAHRVPGVSRQAAALQVAGERFFHCVVPVTPSPATGGGRQLHVLYPEQHLRRERRAAMIPPLIIGAVALVVMTALATAIASRVTRPLGVLKERVKRIAQGDWRPGEVTGPDDEIRELAGTVNQLARTLADYEQQVRQAEQARTLAQLSGGLAHQMRNAVTGARMAVDLHRAECPRGTQDESLEVAERQLILMEQYLERLMAWHRPPAADATDIDLGPLIAHLLPLVQPAARHTGVALSAELAAEPLLVHGDRDALEQLVLNLLWNAIEAAGRVRGATESPAPTVTITLGSTSPDLIMFTVTDTGSGPEPDVATRMFEPFVTGKPDGVGLGLAVAQEVVARHAGTLTWQRHDNRTTFTVQLPRAPGSC